MFVPDDPLLDFAGRSTFLETSQLVSPKETVQGESAFHGSQRLEVQGKFSQDRLYSFLSGCWFQLLVRGS